MLKPRRQLVVEGLEERLVPFSTFGGTWSQPGGLGNPVNVTFSYRNQFDGGIVGISNYTMLQAVEEALSLWARYAPFTFREVASGQITLGHAPLSGSTLANASAPQFGDVTYDDSNRTWNTSLFLETTVHELGHALGLGHSTLRSNPVDRTGSVNEPILNPSIQGVYSGLGSAFLYQDDVNGIRSRYGTGVGEVITPRAWTATTNGNWDTDASWTRGFEPTLNSDATIEDGRIVTVSTGTRNARTITLGNTDGETGTLNVTGGTLNVKRNIRLGGSGTGVLTITLGTVTPAGLTFGGNSSADQQQVTVNGGTLRLNAAITDSTGTSTLTVASGTLDMNNNALTVDRFLYNGGTLTDMGGATTIKSLLQIRNVTLGIPNLTLQGAFTLDATAIGSATVTSNINLGGGTRTFTINNTNASGSDVFFAGVLSNGSLTKTGPGTLKLQGVNTYTGATALNAGEIYLTGSMASGTTTVASGATLSGSGTARGVVNNGSVTVRGDTGVGATLTANGTYVQNAGGTLRVDLGGTTAGSTYDVLRATGNATLGGTVTVSLTNGFALTPGQNFDVLRAPSITLNNLVLAGTPANQLRFSVVTVGTERVLRLTVAGSTVQIIDNGATGFSTAGVWSALTGQGYQSDITSATAGTGSSVASWTFSGLAPGTYRISATWTAATNRATNAPFTILSGSTTLGTRSINQEQAPNDFGAAGAMWEDLGTFTIVGNSLVVRLSNAANELVIADAIRIERVG